MIVYSDNYQELYHHGVKGQKWGVRRYQNPDGSYKAGAEGRYSSNSGQKKRTNVVNKTISSSKVDYKNKVLTKEQVKNLDKKKEIKNLLKIEEDLTKKRNDLVDKLDEMEDEGIWSGPEYDKIGKAFYKADNQLSIVYVNLGKLGHPGYKQYLEWEDYYIDEYPGRKK